ncbi:unnamed protein product [Tuber aestivum]|uniref:Uncharacterized protein n=1 Tax=Tuber aestivum TaxID=59557 RepID=A0A292PL62_9PEZI|nr:unnamed protein product [Tuber aestivum]
MGASRSRTRGSSIGFIPREQDVVGYIDVEGTGVDITDDLIGAEGTGAGVTGATGGEPPVEFRLEDEVHDIRDEVRRLATQLTGMQDRMDESDRRIDERFDTIKEWTEGMKEWTVGVAGTLQTILGKLSDIDSRVVQAERKGKE